MAKKVLVLSNACFSQEDSNGRTLAKLMEGFNKKELAQFFVYGKPDFSVCDNYYQVSDRDALNSFIKRKQYGGKVKEQKAEKVERKTESTSSKIKKTPFSMLLREIAWKYSKVFRKNFFAWVDEFSPEAIVIFLGDNAFLCNLARKIAKKKNIPIYAYSTEDYVFKNYNFVTRRPSLFYKIFFSMLKRAYKKMAKYVKKGIFNTPMLAKAYEEKYSYPCECIFNRSGLKFIEKVAVSEQLKVSYLGNLGLNRHLSLIEVSNALNEVYSDVKLDVYGALPAEEKTKSELLNAKNINYKGFIGYDKVTEVIHQSDLLVHVEYNDKFLNKDLKHAFSTKIADSIASGTPLFMYADASLAETEFLMDNECAFVATSSEQLKLRLNEALSDTKIRKRILNNAKKTASVYFTKENALFDMINA